MARQAREETATSSSSSRVRLYRKDTKETKDTKELERVADAREERAATAIGGAVARPCCAAGERHGHEVQHDHVRRQLAADRRLQVRGAERRVPGVPRIDEHGAVQRVEEERP